MLVREPKATNNRQTAVFFGVLLCVLLAFFAVERRIAAYPTHDIAAAIVAATGVQKPPQVGLADPQSLNIPGIFLFLLVLFAPMSFQCVYEFVDRQPRVARFAWISSCLAVRPPPAR
jgi:hypothetical protein